MAESQRYDVIIIGAGPAGLSASISAHQHKLNALTLEKGNLANTLDYYYQRGKYVMSQPAIIPLRSGLPFEAGSREAVLAAWQTVATEQDLHIRFNEAVQEVVKTDGYFSVTTTQGSYAADNLILAIGKLGNPRRLGIPGEELAHVADRLVNPQDYIDKDIVVIGGGDSAAEVALALADHNRVSMVYRGGDFYRMNDSLRVQLLDKVDRKELSVYFNADPERIETNSLHIGLPEQ